ncbi:MAG TPA: methylmalonyl-CoA epimerase [Kosmotogaceae bacterium]|nr:methylmalonyl-CoA epimerase [Kosmotogaceae bacterium]
MKTKRIDHIGIAVKSIEERVSFFADFLGIEVYGEEVLAERGLKVAILKIGETKIELLEPINLNSQISKFIEKRGEGIHHIAFNVDDIDAAFKNAKEDGYTPLSDSPSPGAGNTRIVFLHPKTTGGVLVELVEGSHQRSEQR